MSLRLSYLAVLACSAGSPLAPIWKGEATVRTARLNPARRLNARMGL
jgi:hypothetical protein